MPPAARRASYSSSVCSEESEPIVVVHDSDSSDDSDIESEPCVVVEDNEKLDVVDGSDTPITVTGEQEGEEEDNNKPKKKKPVVKKKEKATTTVEGKPKPKKQATNNKKQDAGDDDGKKPRAKTIPKKKDTSGSSSDKEESAGQRVAKTPLERIDQIIDSLDRSGVTKESVKELMLLRKQLDGAKIKPSHAKRKPNDYNLYIKMKMSEFKDNGMNPKERFAHCIKLWKEEKDKLNN